MSAVKILHSQLFFFCVCPGVTCLFIAVGGMSDLHCLPLTDQEVESLESVSNYGRIGEVNQQFSDSTKDLASVSRPSGTTCGRSGTYVLFLSLTFNYFFFLFVSVFFLKIFFYLGCISMPNSSVLLF